MARDAFGKLRRHIREALAHRAIQITGPDIIGYLRAVIVLLVGAALARIALTGTALTVTALFAVGARAVSATSALRTPRSSRFVLWTAPLLRGTPRARAAAFPLRIMRIVSTSPRHVHPRSAYHGFTPRQLRLYCDSINAAGPPHLGRPRAQNMSGDVLLSHAVARAVPSAQKGLTSGFGM